MRYLKGKTNLGLYYDIDHDYRLYGYMDSYWAESAADRKNTLGGCYGLGPAMISWFSKKQVNVALSTAEAEYIAACSTCCEEIWLWKLMSGIFDMEVHTTIIFHDKQSCIKMTENLMFHDKLK